MARKKKVDLEMEFSNTQDAPAHALAALRTAAIAVGILFALFGVAWLSMQTQDTLTRDPRFQLAGADSGGEAVSISGVNRASRRAILKAFEQDAGKSLFEIDPEEKRLKIRTVEWVRDATVRRVWPNHLQVAVVERVPVAFLPVAAGMTGRFNNPVSYQPMLIDEDGAVLSVRGSVSQNLPLLIGVRRDEDIERRRAGVAWMLRVLEELKEFRSRIIEVDVSNRDSLRIAMQMPHGVVVLILGSERFLERVRTFHNNYEGIRDRLLPRALLDVSLEGRITAISTGESAGQ